MKAGVPTFTGRTYTTLNHVQAAQRPQIDELHGRRVDGPAQMRANRAMRRELKRRGERA